MFVKTFPCLTASEVAALASHASEIHAALRPHDFVIFPQVLGHDKSSVSYSKVDCDSPLLDDVIALACSAQDMEMAGRILSYIHKATLLHSDYVPHNLFRSGKKLVLIDPHPPENLPFDLSRLYGDPRKEISGFVFCLLTDTGLKQSLLHFNYQCKLVRAFLRGYRESATHFAVSFSPVLAYARDVYHLKRIAGFSMVHAGAHCALAAFLTVIALRSVP